MAGHRSLVPRPAAGEEFELEVVQRIDGLGDSGDLEETYETERQLLYVACTRARDHLLVTCVAPSSEFLDDLRMK